MLLRRSAKTERTAEGSYLSEQLFEGLIVFHLSQLWFDGERQTLEELVSVAVKRHLSRLNQ